MAIDALEKTDRDGKVGAVRFSLAVTGIDKWSILAGCRFALASIVAIGHLGDFGPTGWLSIIPAFGSFEAILGFLLISGYSVSVSYLQQPEGFLWRRIKRLYPIYLSAMAVACFVAVWLEHRQLSAGTLLVNALFLNQLLTKSSFVGPAWTLSLEFWLYCLAPFLARLPKSTTRWIVFGSFGCYVIYTALRTVAHFPYYSGVGFGANLPLLGFIWVAGLRLACSKSDVQRTMRDIGIIFGCHIALAAGIQLAFRYKHHEMMDFMSHDTLIYGAEALTLLGVFMVFKHLVIAERDSVHRSWALRFLGDVSYPLYLLHYSLYTIFSHLGLTTPILLYLGAVAVSALVYWLVDFYSKKRHQKVGVQ